MKRSYLFKKYLVYFSILLFLVLGACAGGRGKGKVKRGKPIPCPVKDC